MKKIIGLLLAVVIFLGGCTSSDAELEMETIPTYVDGETSPIELKVTEDGAPVEGLEVVGSLEMARMDHGLIEVSFEGIGNGIYSGEVELPMAGEWIMDVLIEADGDTREDVITIDVSEG